VLLNPVFCKQRNDCLRMRIRIRLYTKIVKVETLQGSFVQMMPTWENKGVQCSGDMDIFVHYFYRSRIR
jgi:hypothetical protein